MNRELFKNDPRSFAIELTEQGIVSADHLLLCALKYMSHDDVRDMLDCNELSPRFDDDDDEEEEEEEEDFEIDSEESAREWFWDNHPEYLDQYEEGKRQNEYGVDIRTAWCNAIDNAVSDGLISERLAAEVTL